jgi:hypothetical protein
VRNEVPQLRILQEHDRLRQQGNCTATQQAEQILRSQLQHWVARRANTGVHNNPVLQVEVDSSVFVLLWWVRLVGMNVPICLVTFFLSL